MLLRRTGREAENVNTNFLVHPRAEARRIVSIIPSSTIEEKENLICF
jgi:hypothetical protein